MMISEGKSGKSNMKERHLFNSIMHVSQLIHFILIYLDQFLCNFVFNSKLGKETRYVKQGNAKADWWLQARSRTGSFFYNRNAVVEWTALVAKLIPREQAIH